MKSSRSVNLVLLYLSVLACSTAVIFIRKSTVHPFLLPAYRLAIAAVLLLPAFLRQRRRSPQLALGPMMGRSVLPGILLALHFMTWTVGARMTPAANASLLVNLVPLVMPFLLHVWIRERLNRGEWVGTALALGGILWIGAGDFHVDRNHFLGDLVCLLSMLLLAVYLVAARRHRDKPGIWLYVVPVYAVAAIVSFLVSIPVTPVFRVFAPREYLYLLALAAIPTVIGHTLMNHAMRNLRGQIVGVAGVLQFVFAGILAWVFLAELPRWSFYPASLLVLAGVVAVVRAEARTKGS